MYETMVPRKSTAADLDTYITLLAPGLQLVDEGGTEREFDIRVTFPPS